MADSIKMIIIMDVSDSSSGSNQREHFPGVEASAALCEGAAANLHDAKRPQSSWENP